MNESCRHIATLRRTCSFDGGEPRYHPPLRADRGSARVTAYFVWLRMYRHDASDRVRLVQRALQLGFTLSELSEILKVRDGGGVPCHRVLSLTEEKLRSLERQIEELQRTERYMKQLVRQWRVKLAKTKPGAKALLLHSLAGKTPTSRSSKDNIKRRRQP